MRLPPDSLTGCSCFSACAICTTVTGYSVDLLANAKGQRYPALWGLLRAYGVVEHRGVEVQVKVAVKDAPDPEVRLVA